MVKKFLLLFIFTLLVLTPSISSSEIQYVCGGDDEFAIVCSFQPEPETYFGNAPNSLHEKINSNFNKLDIIALLIIIFVGFLVGLSFYVYNKKKNAKKKYL